MRAIEAVQLAELSEAVRESSFKRFRRVDWEQANWRPTDGAMSIADLAQHLIDADRWLIAKLSDPSLPPMTAGVGIASLSSQQEFDALLTELDLAGRKRADLLRSITNDDLSREISDDRYGGPVTVWWVIVRGNLDHEAHHRGQLATYLRILGI